MAVSFIRILFFFILSFSGLQVFAVRSDTVHLKNGDRITGEIKFMADNKLSFKTDRAGTISIEWPEVNRIYSNNYFDIMLSNSERLYGSIQYADSAGYMIVKLGTDKQTKKIASVISIERIKTNFWQRLSGSISLSASYAKANENLQLNGSFDISHRTLKQVHQLAASSVLTQSIGTDLSQRTTASYNIKLIHNTRVFTSFAAMYEKNTQLNINYRTTLFGGAGTYFTRKPTREFYGITGLAGNREQSITEPINETSNLEFVIQGSYHQFKFRDPQIDILTDFTTYTSLSNLGRFRFSYELKILWEIFNDFKLNITFYDNFDNRPPGSETGAVNNDWSILTGITYTL